METENQFLRPLSVFRMFPLSVAVVIRNWRLVLSIGLLFCLPADLLSEGLASALLHKWHPDLLPLLKYLPLLLSFQVNLLGYAALAWAVGRIVEGETPSIAKTLMKLSGRNLFRILGTVLYLVGSICWPILAGILLLAFASSLRLSFPLFVGAAIASLALYSLGFLRNVNYCLGEFPAIFENTFFREAALRSKRLIKGRRVKIFTILSIVGLFPIVCSAVVTEWLPDLMHWPAGDISNLLGILRNCYSSIVNTYLLSVWIVFQTLIYFRLRREKHDLTYYTLARTDILDPAEKIVGSTP